MRIPSDRPTRLSPTSSATSTTAARPTNTVRGASAPPVDGFDPTPAPPVPQAPPPAPLPPTPIETIYTDPFKHDTVGDRFVELLDNEVTKSIDGAFYEIADERILGAFARAAQRGVAVRLVTDDTYFQNEDTQASLDHHVLHLSSAHEYLKEMRREIRFADADELPAVATALLEKLAVLEASVGSANLPEHLAIDFLPVREYLTALSVGDTVELKELELEASRVAGSISSDLGAEKIRQIFRPHYDHLLEAGVQLRDDDDSSNLSHNKYMVLDGKKVWMGSYNLQGLKAESGPNAGLYRTADNAVVLSSPTLAASFLADFRQMFEEGRFNADKSEISGRSVRINGVKVTPFFAPKDPVIANLTADLGALLSKMRAARENGRPMTPPPTIRVAGFAMSYSGTEAMVDMLSLLHREGADVQVVADALSAGSSTSSVKALRARGVKVHVTDPGVMMHHKFLSVDAGREHVVWTGSANFTHPAYFDNDESVLRMESEKMTAAYRAIFDSTLDDVRVEDEALRTAEAPVASSDVTSAEPAWTAVDPSTIRSLAEAQHYARLRWGV
jgi:phosphatidylserine/phosphatidylglycerophosphate/cardiolipin synthase-like enzyme